MVIMRLPMHNMLMNECRQLIILFTQTSVYLLLVNTCLAT